MILDDEKYFNYDGSNVQGNDNYYTNDKSNCPDSVLFAGKEKYLNKVMVWVAISSRGISKPLFRPSKSEAVDSDIYINVCFFSSVSITQTQTEIFLNLSSLAYPHRSYFIIRKRPAKFIIVQVLKTLFN